MTKKKTVILWGVLALGTVLCAVTLLSGKLTREQMEEGTNSTDATQTPNTYTWEEYQALCPEEQDAFLQSFDSVDSFEAWIEEAKPAETTAPIINWDKPGKTPSEYTWEEYQALSPAEQEAFYLWFGSIETFETWMDTVQPTETTTPISNWKKPGKTPDEYTWEEYQALSPAEQEAFYLWFGSAEAFEAWMEAVKPAESTDLILNWDKPGKAPNEYTWEEYQALSPGDQEAFYLWFGSIDAFEAWMDTVKPAESTDPILSWDKPGKAPNEYTWEEYQALSPEEQEAFYQWFRSMDDFEAWMDMALSANA